MRGQKRLWLAGGLIAALAAYTLAGCLLVPGLIERRLSAALATHTGLDVAIGRVRVNPFLLRANLDDLIIGAPGAVPAVTVDNMVAWGRIDDAFRRGLQIDALRLTSPRLTQEATTGLWRYLAGPNETGRAFLIRRIDVVAGELYLPGVAAQGVPATIDHLSITELANDPGRQSDFRLGSNIAGTGTLSASGSLGLNPARIDASLDLAGIELAAFGAPRLPGTQLRLSSAALGGRTQLVVEGDRVGLDGKLSLQRLALNAPGVDKPVFEAHSLSGSAVSVTFAPLTISAQRLQIVSPRLHLMRDFDGAFDGGEWLVALMQSPRQFFPAAGRIELSDGQVELRDFAISPPARTIASGIDGSIAKQHDAVSLELAGQFAGGDLRVGAKWHPTVSAATDEWHLNAVDVKARALSGYLAELTGYTAEAGEFDLMIEARASQTGYRIANTLQLASVEFVEPSAPEPAGTWPLSLAMALLEDADGVVRTSVPLVAPADGATIASQIRDAFAQHVAAIVDRPFDVLGRIAGVPASELGEVVFDAGSAAPSDAARERLAHLATVMQRRPGIGIEVNGRYDPNADRDALARAQIRLHIALATSAGAPDRAARGPLKFTDPRVISVLEEFAGERLPGAQVASLRETFGGAGLDFYAALFDALVANETVSERALKNIARFRAQSVVSELAAAGVAAERLLVARTVQERETQDGVLVVPLRVVKPTARNLKR